MSYAVELRRNEVVRLSLHYGANPQAADDRGRTPLVWAARCGNLQAFELLVSHKGVQHSTKDNEGWSPLAHARSQLNHRQRRGDTENKLRDYFIIIKRLEGLDSAIEAIMKKVAKQLVRRSEVYEPPPYQR